MIINMIKTFRCPHCNKEFFYKKWDESEEHIKECSYQFTDSQKRFKQRIKLVKKQSSQQDLKEIQK